MCIRDRATPTYRWSLYSPGDPVAQNPTPGGLNLHKAQAAQLDEEVWYARPLVDVVYVLALEIIPGGETSGSTDMRELALVF